MNYDIKTGLGKGIKFALTGIAALALVSGFSELTLWGLLETYLKPILGIISVGAVLAWLQNLVKVKFGGLGGLLGFRK